jgi:hypothetical protein
MGALLYDGKRHSGFLRDGACIFWVARPAYNRNSCILSGPRVEGQKNVIRHRPAAGFNTECEALNTPFHPAVPD